MELTNQLLSIPQPRASKLEPHRELIAELLATDTPYRGIREILAERFGLRISTTALFSFVKVRSNGGPRKRKYTLPGPVADARVTAVEAKASISDRLAELKRQIGDSGNPEPKRLFEYEPGKPLTLRRKGDR